MLHKPDFSPLCHIRVQLIQYKLQKVKKNIKYFPKEYTEVQQIIYTEQQENKPNIKSVGVLSTKSVRAVLFSGQCNVWMVCPKSSLLVNEKMFLAWFFPLPNYGWMNKIRNPLFFISKIHRWRFWQKSKKKESGWIFLTDLNWAFQDAASGAENHAEDDHDAQEDEGPGQEGHLLQIPAGQRDGHGWRL